MRCIVESLRTYLSLQLVLDVGIAFTCSKLLLIGADTSGSFQDRVATRHKRLGCASPTKRLGPWNTVGRLPTIDLPTLSRQVFVGSGPLPVGNCAGADLRAAEPAIIREENVRDALTAEHKAAGPESAPGVVWPVTLPEPAIIREENAKVTAGIAPHHCNSQRHFGSNVPYH